MRVRTWASACLLSCAALVAWSASSAVIVADATDAPAPACVTPAQLGLVLVIDDSGSTSSTDPDDLRTEASVIALHQQGTGGVFALSTFSSDTREVVAPTVLTPGSRATAEAAIRGRIVDWESTNYDGAFVEASRQLAAMPSSVDKRAVIFVSDGVPDTRNYTSDLPIGAAGVPIYTVGFGGASQDEMAGIAARSGGQTFPVSAVADLQPTMAKILAVLECDAQNIVEHVDLAPGATKSIPFNVAPTEDEFKALASWGAGNVTASLTRPDGTTMDAAHLVAGERWDSGPTYASGVGADPLRGGWIFQLTASPANLATLDVTINVWGSSPAAPAPDPDPLPPIVVPTPDVTPPVVHEPRATPPGTEHPAPATCSAVGVSRGSQSQVTVSWGAVGGPSTAEIYGYVVSYKPDVSQGAWHTAPATGNLDTVITGHTPATSYTYAVRAQYVDGTLSEPCITHALIPPWQDIVGKAGNDNLKGSDGQDHIRGGAGNDRIDGGDGNDTIDGGVGQDRLIGGSGNDVIKGSSGKDRVDGGRGNDTIDVRDGRAGDVVQCGAGRDKVIADRSDRVAADCEVRTSR